MSRRGIHRRARLLGMLDDDPRPLCPRRRRSYAGSLACLRDAILTRLRHTTPRNQPRQRSSELRLRAARSRDHDRTPCLRARPSIGNLAPRRSRTRLARPRPDGSGTPHRRSARTRPASRGRPTSARETSARPARECAVSSRHSHTNSPHGVRRSQPPSEPAVLDAGRLLDCTIVSDRPALAVGKPRRAEHRRTARHAGPTKDSTKACRTCGTAFGHREPGSLLQAMRPHALGLSGRSPS